MADMANRDSAVQCVDMAKSSMLTGDWEAAIRRLERSQRLVQGSLPGVDALLSRCRQEQDRKARAAAQAARARSASPAPAPVPAPRARAPAPAPTQRTSSARATASTSSAGAGRAPYTSDQLAMVNRVISARSLWAVLGVDEGASGGSIKKAFRKLALRMHPDKNPAPRSKEAFQRVNHAFSVLNDAESRRKYEHTGDDGEGGGADAAHEAAANAARAGRRYQARPMHAEADDMDEFLRQAFFGQGARGAPGGFHFQFGNAGPRRRRQAPRAAGGGGQAEEEYDEMPAIGRLVQILPLLLIFIVALGLLPQQFMTTEPPFSFAAAGSRTRQMFTQAPGLVKRVEYWVTPDKAKRLLSSLYHRSEFESTVQQGKLNFLRQNCAQEEREKSRLQWDHQYAIGRRRSAIREKLHKFQDVRCDEFREFSAQAQRARVRAGHGSRRNFGF